MGDQGKHEHEHGHGKHAHHHGHHHGHGHHHHHHHHSATDNLKVALFLNLTFSLVELAGGLWTGSIAILTDALHDFGDSLSLALAWALERSAARQPTAHYTYGYRRMSLLSAFITCLILIVGSVVVLSAAIPRLWEPVLPHVDGMIGFALLGTAVNGYAAWRLTRGTTLNERVVSWHLIEDVLGWAAVLVSAIVMKFTEWALLDPILSILITLFIIRGVFRSLGSTVRLFLQATPEGLETPQLTSEMEKLPGVVQARDLKVWSLDGASHVLTVRLLTDPALAGDRVADLKLQIRSRFAALGTFDMTIETDPAPPPAADEQERS